VRTAFTAKTFGFAAKAVRDRFQDRKDQRLKAIYGSKVTALLPPQASGARFNKNVNNLGLQTCELEIAQAALHGRVPVKRPVIQPTIISRPARVTNNPPASSYWRGGDDDMRNLLTWVLGIALAVDGIVMLAAPAGWYAAIPGVPETGPFNPHFVSDTGAAYLAAGASLLWFAAHTAGQAAAQTGSAFLGLHALIHILDIAAGREHAHQLLTDLPAVFLPAVLAIWIAWPRRQLYRGVKL
jgi:hypothetical protein